MLDKEKKACCHPKKGLKFSSFEKQKEYGLALLKTTF